MHLSLSFRGDRAEVELRIWLYHAFHSPTPPARPSCRRRRIPTLPSLSAVRAARVYGNLVQLLVTMKGLPLAYNKDLQEDKEGALDTAHTVMQCLSVMAGMISTWTVNEDAMARECGVGHLAATDVAGYLAKRGLPFREAHAVVGHLVLMCEKRGCNLEDLPFEVFQEASPLFERDITEALDIPSIVAARTTEGGTAPAAVAVQLGSAEAQLAADEGVFGSLPRSSRWATELISLLDASVWCVHHILPLRVPATVGIPFCYREGRSLSRTSVGHLRRL